MIRIFWGMRREVLTLDAMSNRKRPLAARVPYTINAA